MFYKVIILYFKCISKRKQRSNALLNLVYSLCDDLHPQLCLGGCGYRVSACAHVLLGVSSPAGMAVGYPAFQHNTVYTSPCDLGSPWHCLKTIKTKAEPSLHIHFCVELYISVLYNVNSLQNRNTQCLAIFSPFGPSPPSLYTFSDFYNSPQSFIADSP